MSGARPGLAVLLALLAMPALPAAAAAAPELRDPMQPPPLALRKMRAAKQAAAPKRPAQQSRVAPKPFRLTSILVGPDRSVAIIDDRLMALGDSIRGARLVRLTRNSARLLQRGKIIELELDGGAGAGIGKKTVQDKP